MGRFNAPLFWLFVPRLPWEMEAMGKNYSHHEPHSKTRLEKGKKRKRKMPTGKGREVLLTINVFYPMAKHPKKRNFGWEFRNIFEAKSLTYRPEAKTLMLNKTKNKAKETICLWSSAQFLEPSGSATGPLHENTSPPHLSKDLLEYFLK